MSSVIFFLINLFANYALLEQALVRAYCMPYRHPWCAWPRGLLEMTRDRSGTNQLAREESAERT